MQRTEVLNYKELRVTVVTPNLLRNLVKEKGLLIDFNAVVGHDS